MPIPEFDSPDYAVIEHRVNRRIMDAVSNVAVRQGDLPWQVHVLIYDELTGERFGAFVGVQYIGDSRSAQVTRTSIGRLNPNASPRDVANKLIELKPDTPLILDDKLAKELADDSITWFDDGHFRLQGVTGGTIEVFTPFKSHHAPKDSLPPNMNAQLFDE